MPLNSTSDTLSNTLIYKDSNQQLNDGLIDNLSKRNQQLNSNELIDNASIKNQQLNKKPSSLINHKN